MVTHLTRRSFSFGMGAAAAMGAVSKSCAQTSGTVVIASWGGQTQDSQRKAMFEPFTKAAGIKVVEASGPTLAKIRAMSMSGNIEWDIAQFSPDDFLALAENHLLEEIDYGALNSRVMSQLDQRLVHPFGVGAGAYAVVNAFSTKAFPAGKGPQSWADVWDTQRFPGPRMFYAPTLQPINEFALMADGVLPQDLYPLDLERSYRSLSRIKPHIVKWTTTGAMGPQALVGGEAVIIAAGDGRIAQLKSQGAQVDFVWNQALFQSDYWAIPKGAKNPRNALKFIDFVSQAETQAEYFKLQPGGPTNLETIKLLSPEIVRRLITYPDNLRQTVLRDAAWWGEKTNGKTNKDRNIEMWNTWVRG